MNRRDIEHNYDVHSGIIFSPGKFEAEPVFVPYFYDLSLNGCADYDEVGNSVFIIEEEDVEEFPELQGVHQITLYESDSGFVGHSLEYI